MKPSPQPVAVCGRTLGTCMAWHKMFLEIYLILAYGIQLGVMVGHITITATGYSVDKEGLVDDSQGLIVQFWECFEEGKLC